MQLTGSACYRAVLARDARYDGRFFTCVKRTGIYCRPICPARPPKPENCRFVPTAAAAQAAGFRPCLRCRPESSPDLDAWRGTSSTVSRALRLIEGGALDTGGDVAALAERLGIGERHLRRLFLRHVGATPVTVAQTRRVLLAKQLIHQTKLPMIQVALASGFGSVRRFNETFQQLYHRPPSELRGGGGGGGPADAVAPQIELLLPYRPPYDWAAMLAFLKTRAIGGLEVVNEESYSRVIRLGDTTGSITVSHAPKRSALRVVVRFAQLDQLSAIITRVRRMFDLSADPAAIARALSSDPVLAPLVGRRPGLRVPGGWDGFEIAVRAVLGQQITVNAATQLATRMVASIGMQISDGSQIPGLTHAFPTPEHFDASKLARLGMPASRAATLEGVARAIVDDERLFDPRRDLDGAVERLRSLPGVGEWTAQYIAMRALGESDAFLAGDVAVQRKLAADGKPRPSVPQLLARAERWRPWRAYAVLHLWMSHNASAKTSPRKARETRHAITA
jgi:AraC family transcriptional regulator of adaptative response / DNA-3-methyladenine glycosylase II